MRSKDLDLYLVVAFACLSALSAILGAGTPAAVLALPLALFLPGHALTRAILDGNDLDLAARLCVAGTLSLTADALTGMAINQTPWGLTQTTWCVALVVITVTAAAAAMLRRHKARATSSPPRISSRTIRDAFLLGITILTVLLAVQVARAGASAQRDRGFTQLWLLPVHGHAATLQLGVYNGRAQTGTYQIVIRSSRHIVKIFTGISLTPGHSWELTFVDSDLQKGAVQTGAVLTGTAGGRHIYRRVTLDQGIYRTAAVSPAVSPAVSHTRVAARTAHSSTSTVTTIG